MEGSIAIYLKALTNFIRVRRRIPGDRPVLSWRSSVLLIDKWCVFWCSLSKLSLKLSSTLEELRLISGLKSGLKSDLKFGLFNGDFGVPVEHGAVVIGPKFGFEWFWFMGWIIDGARFAESLDCDRITFWVSGVSSSEAGLDPVSPPGWIFRPEMEPPKPEIPPPELPEETLWPSMCISAVMLGTWFATERCGLLELKRRWKKLPPLLVRFGFVALKDLWNY